MDAFQARSSARGLKVAQEVSTCTRELQPFTPPPRTACLARTARRKGGYFDASLRDRLSILRRLAPYRVLRIAGVAGPAILTYRWLQLRERLGWPAPPATWQRVHDRVARRCIAKGRYP